jgi:hypothetical protein
MLPAFRDPRYIAIHGRLLFPPIAPPRPGADRGDVARARRGRRPPRALPCARGILPVGRGMGKQRRAPGATSAPAVSVTTRRENRDASRF